MGAAPTLSGPLHGTSPYLPGRERQRYTQRSKLVPAAGNAPASNIVMSNVGSLDQTGLATTWPNRTTPSGGASWRTLCPCIFCHVMPAFCALSLPLRMHALWLIWGDRRVLPPLGWFHRPPSILTDSGHHVNVPCPGCTQQ